MAATRMAPSHHEDERWVPAPGDVEEGQYLGGVAHPGQDQARAEQQAGDEGGNHGHGIILKCDASRKRWRRPASMKHSVATSERGDSLAMPQTPWPLVQPEPKRVPRPTSRPATASSPGVWSIWAGGMACIASQMRGEASRPSRKARRQAMSPRAGRSRPPVMPLMPAMRPLASSSRAAPRPISRPPAVDASGVKCRPVDVHGRVSSQLHSGTWVLRCQGSA
jgi:hypothetical protein